MGGSSSAGFELSWGPAAGTEAPSSERRAVQSADQLDSLLDELERAGRAGEPLIAILGAPSGATLGIGLGAARSVVTFEGADGMPFISVGDGDLAASGEDSLVFYLEGEWTELPADAAVSPEIAREAMRRFLASGERPDNLDWTLS